MDLKDYIRAVPDYPQPGVVFRDITPLLADPRAWAATIRLMGEEVAALAPDFIVGMESRGFIFAAPLSFHLNTGFIPIRKPRKLPCPVYQQEYALEYGTDQLEIHRDCFSSKPGGRVLIVDDVIATGGTARAAAQLVHQAGGHLVGYCFLVELTFLKGTRYLDPAVPLTSLVQY